MIIKVERSNKRQERDGREGKRGEEEIDGEEVRRKEEVLVELLD